MILRIFTAMLTSGLLATTVHAGDGPVLTATPHSDADSRRQAQFAADEARAQQRMAESRRRSEAAVREAQARDRVSTGTPCKPGSGCSIAK